MSAEATTIPVRIRTLEGPVSQLRLLRTVLRNPLEAMPASVFSQPIARRRFMRRDLLYSCDPELIRQVLVEQEASFVKADAMRRALVPALGQGLLTAEGAHWRWQRRAAAPIFRHDRLLGFVPAMIQAAQATVQRWTAPEARSTRVDMLHEMMQTTYNVIVETMLSGAPGLDQGRIERGVAEYLEATPWAVMTSLFGIPGWVPHPKKRQGRAARDYVREALIGIVQRRRQTGSDTSANKAVQGDLLALLLQAQDPETGQVMNDRELADNLLTFIVAGHETTALTLSWSFYLLARHPKIEALVLAEIAQVTGGDALRPDHVPELAYTRQVIQETMRLYPPAALVTRMAATDVQLGSLTVAAGTPTYVPVYAVHRHLSLWDNPDAFDPERFRPEAVKARHRYAYLPFGAGPRICIGASFAMLEAVAILTTVLRSVRPSLPPGFEPSPRLRITLRPHGGLPMQLTPRPGAA
ncbi:cytochrome P450 [Acidisphaera sp. L21]|uniref:cytochrome P450 n=1 Tax=Acidisphaera sp. L21 TaxID=1641851 RepID=UPI00131BBDED|nr:cytochrome P450 [Acidisphaera sp. L21]